MISKIKSVIYAMSILFLSQIAAAQVPSFSTETGVLDIPEVTVDDEYIFDDVSFSLDFETNEFLLLNADFTGTLSSEEVNLGFMDNVVLENGDTLTFLDVIGDSRCPSDVVCITAGEVWVLLQLTRGGERYRFGLHLNPSVDPTGHEINGILFRLLAVNPYPMSTITLENEDYQISVNVLYAPS